MVGITSFGAYVPMLRLPLATIGGGKAKEGGPEKAVANYDEDALTLAVAAATVCLQGIDRRSVDGVMFASTTYPFKEKQGSSIIARALDLRRDVLTADFGDSLRAGTTALRAAADAIKAGSAKRVLVLIGDTRMASPRSAMEANLGDAGAAFLLGDDASVAATIGATHQISDEIIDVWRTEGDPFVHGWEDRFVVDHGYRQSVRECVRGLLEKAAAKPADFAKLVLFGPDARSHGALVRELKFEPAQAQDAFFGKIGNAGCAFAPLLLAAALEEAKPGDRLLLVGYGDGADAMVLEVGPAIDKLKDRRGVRWHLKRRAELPNYDVYLRFRQLLATEHDRRAGAGLSATKHFRDRDEEVSLLAQRCRKCSRTQYPRQRVCFCCHAKDEFEKIRLSDRIGSLKSFTFDMFAGSPQPPLVATVTDVDGARLYLQMTDVNAKEVKLDLPVELTFRKIHEAGGTPNYYWKCTPVR